MNPNSGAPEFGCTLTMGWGMRMKPRMNAQRDWETDERGCTRKDTDFGPVVIRVHQT